MINTPGELIVTPGRIKDVSNNMRHFEWTNEKHPHLKVKKIPSATINPYVQVDISDALSEKDKVKFTVHTRTGRQFAW